MTNKPTPDDDWLLAILADLLNNTHNAPEMAIRKYSGEAAAAINAKITELLVANKQALLGGLLEKLPEPKQKEFVASTSPNTTTTDENKCRFYRYGGYDFALTQCTDIIKEQLQASQPINQ